MCKELKRFTALILSLVMFLSVLPLEAHAGVTTGGTGSDAVGSAATGSSGWGIFWKGHAGLALSLQFMEGASYTVNQLDIKEDEAEGISTGMANVLKHFAVNYPDPYLSDELSNYAYYILDNCQAITSQGAPYQFMYGGSTPDRERIPDTHYAYRTDSPAPSSNLLGKALYDKAISNALNSDGRKPSPHLNDGEFDAIVATLTEAQAEKDLMGLFNPHKEESSGSNSLCVPDYSEINTRVKKYIENGITAENIEDPYLIGAREMCNYVALILSVAKSAYDDSHYQIAKQKVKDMLENYLAGKSFQPIMVVSEIVDASKHADASASAPISTYRTAREALGSITHMNPEVFSSISLNSSTATIADDILSGNYSKYTSDSSLHNASAAMLGGVAKLYSISKTDGYVGGRELLYMRVINGKVAKGAYYDADTGSYGRGSVARGTTAVSSDWISIAGEKLGQSWNNVQAPWGVGVFGVFAPMHQDPPPATYESSELYAGGQTGITATPPVKVVESLSYARPVDDVTVYINLDAHGAMLEDTYLDGELIEHTYDKFNSLVDTLRWMWHAGAEPPEIKVWVKQSQGIDSSQTGDNYFNTLVDSYHAAVTHDVLSLEQGKLQWTNVSSSFTFAEEMDGMSISMQGDGLLIKVLDYEAAINYFENNNATLTLKGNNLILEGKLNSQNSINEHYFKVGAAVTMCRPTSIEDLSTPVRVQAGLETYNKYDRVKITMEPENIPHYYSALQPAYAEFKQGTVPSTGGGSQEEFNSMTGTPTITNGKYYQYFAAGGSEFVVEFEAQYIASDTTSRTYTASYTSVVCDKDNTNKTCHTAGTHITTDPDTGEVTEKCSGHESCDEHSPCKDHTVSDTFTWTQSVQGFSYIKITNAHVWKLSEARVDGTRELLDTDEVYATVKSVDTSAFYHVASSNSSAAGRFVYSYEGGQHDSVSVLSKESDNSCESHKANNQTHLDGATSGITCGAVCISDFLILRTSDGDQSILYYEYNSKGAAAINTGGCVSKPIEFSSVPYATIWTNNPMTAAGMKLEADGITFGGYNGNYLDVTSKYTSASQGSNISLTTSLTAVLNPNSVYMALPDTPNPVFRLLNDSLVIKDTKPNGEYIIGNAHVFYKYTKIAGSSTLHQATRQELFNNQIGFVLSAPYSPEHSKINDIVVYNPVSVEEALVVSLPSDRDQRTNIDLADENYEYITGGVCPGDYTCIYATLTCTHTGGVHTEDCYVYSDADFSYDRRNDPEPNVHIHTAECTDGADPHHPSGLNAHEHTDACAYTESEGSTCTGELNIHRHGENCYVCTGELNVHDHTDACYRAGDLWCEECHHCCSTYLQDYGNGLCTCSNFNHRTTSSITLMCFSDPDTHVHTDACLLNPSCTLDYNIHEHTDDCPIATVDWCSDCGAECSGTFHLESCRTCSHDIDAHGNKRVYTCDEPLNEHQHSASCYSACGASFNKHVHSGACPTVRDEWCSSCRDWVTRCFHTLAHTEYRTRYVCDNIPNVHEHGSSCSTRTGQWCSSCNDWCEGAHDLGTCNVCQHTSDVHRSKTIYTCGVGKYNHHSHTSNCDVSVGYSCSECATLCTYNYLLGDDEICPRCSHTGSAHDANKGFYCEGDLNEHVCVRDCYTVCDRAYNDHVCTQECLAGTECQSVINTHVHTDSCRTRTVTEEICVDCGKAPSFVMDDDGNYITICLTHSCGGTVKTITYTYYRCGNEPLNAHKHTEDCYWGLRCEYHCNNEPLNKHICDEACAPNRHEHTDACYTLAPGSTCTEELNAHEHGRDCPRDEVCTECLSAHAPGQEPCITSDGYNAQIVYPVMCEGLPLNIHEHIDECLADPDCYYVHTDSCKPSVWEHTTSWVGPNGNLRDGVACAFKAFEPVGGWKICPDCGEAFESTGDVLNMCVLVEEGCDCEPHVHTDDCYVGDVPVLSCNNLPLNIHICDDNCVWEPAYNCSNLPLNAHVCDSYGCEANSHIHNDSCSYKTEVYHIPDNKHNHTSSCYYGDGWAHWIAYTPIGSGTVLDSRIMCTGKGDIPAGGICPVCKTQFYTNENSYDERVYTYVQEYTGYLCNNRPANTHTCTSACGTIDFVYSCNNSPNVHVHDEDCGYEEAYGYKHDPGQSFENVICWTATDYGPVCPNCGQTGTWGPRVWKECQDPAPNVHEHSNACKVPDCNNAPLNYHTCSDTCCANGSWETVDDHTASLTLVCNDSHHALNYNWKLYTMGLKHTSGVTCTGRPCTDTSKIVMPDGTEVSQAVLAAGFIVRHNTGSVHLSTSREVCTYCNRLVNTVLSNAQSTDRVVTEGDWDHNPSCYTACMNDANHKHEYKTETTDPSTGSTVKMATFLQLDWGFHMIFPNRGDFYGTGVKASAQTSAERGWGYTNGMDTTQWTAKKWVMFPFDVIWEKSDGTRVPYGANTRIYLPVPEEEFDFYIPLENVELAAGQIRYGAVAINNQLGDTVLDCDEIEPANITEKVLYGYSKAHSHSASKMQFIDLIGRIGQLTIEDTGDFRFSNLLKNTLDTWYINHVVKDVDETTQTNIITDPVDIRGIVQTAEPFFNTYGTRPERNQLGLRFPLTPAMNSVAALKKQPMRLGYNLYMDLTTLGNYYGENFDGDALYKVQITPLYYHLDLNTGVWTPVDVYTLIDGKYTLINKFNDYTDDAPAAWPVSINWTEEQARRNYSGLEAEHTKAIGQSFGVEVPNGINYTYGTPQRLFLKDRNRTFIGSQYTNGVNNNPGNAFNEQMYWRQGQRWNFSIGLPSSSVFVKEGVTPTEANIKELTSSNAVIVCALNIKAKGTVWTLEYDGSSINTPFQVLDGGRTYDPAPVLGKNPIVGIFSVDKSSRDDLNTSGTH